MNYAGLMKLPRDSEQLLKLLLAQMVQHTRVHHISGETFRVLAQAEIWQPLGAHPGVTELSDTGISNVTWVPMFLDSQTQLLSMKRVSYA